MANVTTDTNYSDVQQADNGNFNISAGAKLTISQSTADLRYIRCNSFGSCLVKNESTATPIIVALGSTGSTPQFRFTAAAFCDVEGEWITLGTGDGTIGQTFNVPLAQGVHGSGTQSCPDLGGLWINGTNTLRDGTAVPTLALQVDADGYTNATDHARGGNVFTQDTTNNTVTFKRAIPVGQELYMANIIFKTGASMTQAKVDWSLSSTGVMRLDKCHWSGAFNFNVSSARKAKLQNIALLSTVLYSLEVSNQVESPEISNMILSSPRSRAIAIQNSALAGQFTNIWVDSNREGNLDHTITILNTNAPTLESVIATQYQNTGTANIGSTARSVINCSAPDMSLKDCYFFNPIQVVQLASGAKGAIVDNVNFQFGSREDITTDIVSRIIRVAGAVDGAVLTNFRQIKAGPCLSSGICISVGAGVSNCTFSGMTFRSGGASDTKLDSIMVDNGNSCRYNDIVFHGQTLDRAVTFEANSLSAKASNIYYLDEQTEHSQSTQIGAKCEINQVGLSDSGDGSFNNSSIATGVDCLSVIGVRNTGNETDGLFELRFSPTADEVNYLTETVKNGVIEFSNTNRLYIGTEGDVVELESFVHNNIASISGDISQGGNQQQRFLTTVKMRRPDGAYTNYVAGTQSAMQSAFASLATDSLNRVQFKFRIEKEQSDLQHYLSRLNFNVTLTGDDYPFILEELKVNISGLVAGSRIQLYNVTKGTEVTNATVSLTTASIDYESGVQYSEGDVVRLRVTYQEGTNAYLPFETIAIASSVGISFIASQELDTIYNSNNINGTTVSTLTSDFPNVQVDINDADGDADVREIYAKYVYTLTTSQGIRDWFNGVTAIDNVNYRVNTSVLDLTIQNVGSVAINLSSARIYRDDGAIILAAEDGDKPITQDNGEFVQFIQPQINGAMNTNAKLDGVSKNTNLIPALL